ncbi:NUDIX hydrolase [Dactylosporangium sp. NBC_01737]|uniref:NUDIX hydrolase n=1 Tax=Dactylosporangium sp. NBC_01737 TaxID=2975959 RepID=UPI002E0F5F66|nr:NUDIX hydrolase [Dactylosporangium sp. NBC_01737]
MHDADVAEWLAGRVEVDVRTMLETVERSYQHPYGFTVYRLGIRQLAPWQLRVHIWPGPLLCYQHLHLHRTESQLIHAHGWDLLSAVVSGELEERTYELKEERSADFGLYSTAPIQSHSTSILRTTGKRLAMQQVKKQQRRPEHGAFAIAAGVYHSTLPAKPSISLVATRQFPGQISHVAMFRGTDDHISNASPAQQPDLRLPSSPEAEPDNWASFAFFLRGEEVLLVRTRDHPHQWQPVGGRKNDSDSSPVDTLIREVGEETGALIDPVMADWSSLHEADAGTGVVCFWTITEFRFDDPIRLQREELLEARWWNIAEAKLLPMYSASTEALTLLANRMP